MFYRCKYIRQKEKDVDWVHCLLDSLTSNVDIIPFDFLYSLYAVTIFFIRNSSIRNTTENIQRNKYWRLGKKQLSLLLLNLIHRQRTKINFFSLVVCIILLRWDY